MIEGWRKLAETEHQITFIPTTPRKRRGVVAIQTIPAFEKFGKPKTYSVRSSKLYSKYKRFIDKDEAIAYAEKIMKRF